MTDAQVVQVALPVPMRQLFDYSCTNNQSLPVPGMRVMVPLQKRTVVGIVCGRSTQSAVPMRRLRHIIRVLDDEPILTSQVFALAQWAARYYHHPIGEVMQAAIPSLLRRDRPAAPRVVPHWRICDAGQQALSTLPVRYHVQRHLLQVLVSAGTAGLAGETLLGLVPRSSSTVALMADRGWIEQATPASVSPAPLSVPPRLNSAQRDACLAIDQAKGNYVPFLLDGVTGSGKTEVYLDCVAKTVSRGCQAMVLVPEISLTPQLVERFQARLGGSLAVLHSGLTPGERHRAWWRSREGSTAVVLGTRSAIFAPLSRPGLIIVDEEHDLSYKQRDRFRYSARDVAVKRAQLSGVPVVLGSATPSLESVANARSGRYQRLVLPVRAGVAQMPKVQILDLNRLAVNEGLTAPVVGAIGKRLERAEQSLVFVNRRGFAPLLGCSECGWQAQCQRCDARLTLHRGSNRLICHHCGANAPPPHSCPQCADESLYLLGEGTQRVEEALLRIFPNARVLRLDSDAAGDSQDLAQALGAVRQGEVDILVGTQMLSKGHDFAGITLVCVLAMDQGLYSIDFRGPERMFQQLAQVAGRAGRGQRPGEVLVQTVHPDNPAYARLVEHDFAGFANTALAERKAAAYPPFARFVLLRAESARSGPPLDFLRSAVRVGKVQAARAGVRLMEPVPSPMERRAGRYRAQLLLAASNERQLHRFLDDWLARVEGLREAIRVRWSVDVDPQEMY